MFHAKKILKNEKRYLRTQTNEELVKTVSNKVQQGNTLEIPGLQLMSSK